LISGSLRKKSYNRMLLWEAARAFGPAQVEEADLNLPLYDGDLEEKSGLPASLHDLGRAISQADAVVIAAPEYNKGITGVLKNALDWISRLEGGVMAGKPVVIVSAAAGRTGGETAQYMTLCCVTALGAQVVPGPMILVASAHEAFDEDGTLKRDSTCAALQARMQVLRAVI